MSELDEHRRRPEAGTEIPAPPPEPPQQPVPVDGTTHTGEPRDRGQAQTEPSDEQGEPPPAVTGKPEIPRQDEGSVRDHTVAAATPADSEPAAGDNPAAAAEPQHDTTRTQGGTSQDNVDGQPHAEAETRDRTPRFNARDMQPTGRTDPLYEEALYIGADGKEHFDGDPTDTRRNTQGRLIKPDGTYVSDPNPRPTDNLQERAQQDVPTRRHYQPEPGATPADDAVVAEKNERDSIEKARDASWEKIKDIASKLSPHDVKIEKSSDRNENQALLDDAKKHLSVSERLLLRDELPKLAKLNQAIKTSSERLGTAGGALAVQKEFPSAVLVSGGDGQKGTPGNLDRVVMIDEKRRAVIVIEEKGVSSGLGSRIVPDTANPGGKNIRAEQGSTSYLRHLLQTDNKLATALDRNPALRQKMQAIINGGGQIRYLAARTARDGKISVTDFKLDFARLRRATIVLPTRRKGA